MYAARAGLAHPCRSDGAMRMAVADSVFKKIKNSARGREMESRKERSVGRARRPLSPYVVVEAGQIARIKIRYRLDASDWG